MKKAVFALFQLAVVAAGCQNQSPTPSTYPSTKLTRPAGTNRIASIRSVASSPVLNGRPCIEIEVTSTKEFPVRNEFVALHIGNKKFLLSHYPDTGNLHTLIFTLSKEEFNSTRTGNNVWVQYGEDSDNRWDFGLLTKELLK